MITPVCNLKISTDNPFLTEKKPKLVATTSLLYHLASLISRRSLHPEDLVTLDCCYACPTDAPVRALFSLSSELLLHFLSVNSCSPPSCKFLTLPRNVLVLPLSTCMPVCGVQHRLSVAVLPYSAVSSQGRDQFRPLCTLSSWHASWHELTLLGFTDGEPSLTLLFSFKPIHCHQAFVCFTPQRKS